MVETVQKRSHIMANQQKVLLFWTDVLNNIIASYGCLISLAIPGILLVQIAQEDYSL